MIFPLIAACSNQGAIRLTNGTYGNVQICYNNSWGIICDDDWDLKDGNVVCNELQYQRALSVSYSSHYGTGSTDDHIWMDNVNCNGSESRLQDCPFKGWGRHDCNHGDAAGVRCKGENEYIYILSCSLSLPSYHFVVL